MIVLLLVVREGSRQLETLVQLKSEMKQMRENREFAQEQTRPNVIIQMDLSGLKFYRAPSGLHIYQECDPLKHLNRNKETMKKIQTWEVCQHCVNDSEERETRQQEREMDTLRQRVPG